jgi:hypothetical protein
LPPVAVLVVVTEAALPSLSVCMADALPPAPAVPPVKPFALASPPLPPKAYW